MRRRNPEGEALAGRVEDHPDDHLAGRQLQQAALVDGILKSADQNARSTVNGMLTGLGFTQVALQ